MPPEARPQAIPSPDSGSTTRSTSCRPSVELDAAAGNHPLHLFHTSGHNVLVNSLVLSEAGIDQTATDPAGGRFVRDGDGRLTGLCLDAACGLVLPTAVDIGSHGPNFHTRAPMEALVAAVDRASRAYLAAGLTCVADAQVTVRELAAYREARARGVLGVRTVCMPLSHQLDAYRSDRTRRPVRRR